MRNFNIMEIIILVLPPIIFISLIGLMILDATTPFKCDNYQEVKNVYTCQIGNFGQRTQCRVELENNTRVTLPFTVAPGDKLRYCSKDGIIAQCRWELK